MKKAIPYIFILVLFGVAFGVKQCREGQLPVEVEKEVNSKDNRAEPTKQSANGKNNLADFRDPASEYFFTKHARCRMKCRSITQEEVKEIVRKAEVNYNKSELDAAQGPKYALEGYTSRDKQHVRIIVAPKRKHLTIVTVIDLDYDWECPSCK
jgi:Domain of unknown function (DUF4258)